MYVMTDEEMPDSEIVHENKTLRKSSCNQCPKSYCNFTNTVQNCDAKIKYFQNSVL
jgi:hypothetical protein